ncbi:MAG TPA: sigma-54 dependent transcriptional regulator [Pyrinomonadaceae bacterium]|nr:sigma-54 dependent transcriptional regulator [Pyrinomonadaceae bacterium]
MNAILETSLDQNFHLRRETFDGPQGAGGAGLPAAVSLSRPDLIFLVLPPAPLAGQGSLISSVVKAAPDAPLVTVMEAGEPDEMFNLLELGAADFVTPPLKAGDIVPRVWRVLNYSRREGAPVHALKERLGVQQLIGRDEAFLNEVKKIPLIAKCDASILISGETGTGKEVCARAIHYLSPRANKPFVPVNCGAIPLELVENELFGHEKGAFTGASTSELGLITEAEGGTLFLDEVDCLPLLAQVKLLRFLQEKEYRPLGSRKTYKANVRIMAATNTNLEEAVGKGRLRQDLYYRLSIFPLTLPPLRERAGDIMLLANHYLLKYAAEFGKEAAYFSPAAVQELMLYDWPGNVRELEHVIERAVITCEGDVIENVEIGLRARKPPGQCEPLQMMKTRVVEQFERDYIQKLLLICQGNITKAAQVARKNRRAFWELIRKYRIDVRPFKPNT